MSLDSGGSLDRCYRKRPRQLIGDYMLRPLFKMFSERSRRNRSAVFHAMLQPTDSSSILDLGGSDGSHIAGIVSTRRNVCISDLNVRALELAAQRFGFRTIALDGTERLPIGDCEFDIVFCSSVIEHVTGPKDIVVSNTDNISFVADARRYQRIFAEEIRRVGRRYFVQTPYRYFPIESHSWLPMPIIWLRRCDQIRILNVMGKFWPKKTQADWHLLTYRDMRELFPDAEIVAEKSFGFTKSLMAIRR